MKKIVVFVIAGCLAGLITAVLGTSGPSILAVGVGPLFFVAMLASIAATNGWSQVQRGNWRYLVAALLSTIAYVLALFTFSVVMGYAPQIAGFRASRDLVEFGGDVWLGLGAAVVVAATSVELVVFALTNKWSNFSLLYLALSGFASVLVSFVANAQAHHYWSFFGTLLPVGEALFCGVVGAQIWRSTERVAPV